MEQARCARQAAFALLLVLAVLGALWPRTRVLPLSVFDQPFYLGIADDLLREGRFTDGFLFAEGEPHPAGMRFAPLYPAFLAAAARLDGGFAQAMRCVVASQARDAACPQSATLPRAAQFAMLAAVYLLLWASAALLAGRMRVAWLALGLGLLCAPVLMRSVPTMMTEVLALLFTSLATTCAVAAARRGRPGLWLAGAGLALGLAALTRPAFLYLIPAAVLGGVVLAARARRGWGLCAGFALAALVPLVPWMARNAVELGHFALTHGYDSHTLVQRVSFNAMDWGQYALSFLCWLPDGSGMADALVGKGACTVFMWEERPDTFYMIGQHALMQATVAAAGGWDNHLHYLLSAYILPHALWHAAVTLPLALRGAWIDHWWGVVLAPLALLAAWRAMRAGDRAAMALYLPGWFMLAFNAAVAVNQERYNLMLVVPFACAGACALDGLWRRRAARHKPAS